MNKPLCIAPMKINKIPDGKENMFPSLCNSGDYFAELKKDGYWYQFEKTDVKSYLFSRTTSAVTGTLAEKSANVPHIMDIMNHLPSGTIVIGEIYYPNKRSKDVTPIMGSLPDKAIERQAGEYGYLHYYIHDIIYYNHINLMNYGASIRYSILKKVYEKFMLESYTVNNEIIVELAARVDDNIQEAVANALATGEEGMVLKKKTAPYSPGKRPAWDTIKIKKTDTCDAICLGWCDPTVLYDGKLDLHTNYCKYDSSGNLLYGESCAKEWPYWTIFIKDETNTLKSYRNVPIGTEEIIKGINFSTRPVTKAYYYGWKTSMKIGAYDENGSIKEIGTISSGLNDELEKDAAYHPEKYIGQVVELSGMEKDSIAQTLRHFHFKAFRTDKDAKDCTLKEIFDI